MRRTTRYFFVGMGVVIFLVLVFFTVSFLINSASDESSTFYVQKVTGTLNFANPGGETFWGGVPTINVPLIASSNYPPSGATSHVSVQIAWSNSTGVAQLFVKLKFQNAAGGSTYGTSTAYTASSLLPYVNSSDLTYPKQTIVPMYQNLSCTNQYSPCFGGFYPQDAGYLPLATGTSYVYPEQATVILGIAPGANTDAWFAVSYKPKMVPGTAGALGTGSGGAAELWTWSSNPTDNSTSDSGYPGLRFPNGTALNTASFGLPSRASYAMDGYANVSDYYQIGGMPNSSQFLYINNPSLETDNITTIGPVFNIMNPFEVQAKGVYDSGSNSWTVEFMRNLTTSSANGENAYQQQFDPNNPHNYYIAFEVNQGGASETYLLYYGSISFWWRLNFRGTPAYVGYNNQYGAITDESGVSLLGVLLVSLMLISYCTKRSNVGGLPLDSIFPISRSRIVRKRW
jgi:hypothetical protein